jgi:putative copper resistance protein D
MILWAIRAVYFAAALQLFGLLNFRLFFPLVPSRRWALALVAAALVALMAWLAFEAGAMGGEGIAAAIRDGTLGTVLTQTRFGDITLARAALLVGVGAALAWRGRVACLCAAAAAGAALALTAATGHAGAETGPGGQIHLAADMLHLLGAGAWLGGLLPFVWAMTHTPALAHADSLRFSLLGTICVGILLASGGINSWFLVGNVPALIGTGYGRLLLVKIALFAAMVVVAAINRWRLTPLIRTDAAAALPALRRNALAETALGLGIVMIVSVLGTLPPAYYGAE